MGRLIVLIISTIVATVYTLKVFWLQLNGQSTIEIINRLPVLFTPAVYVFALWFVIFAFLFVWCFHYSKYSKLNNDISTLQTSLYVLAIIFQIISLYNFHQENLYTSLVLLVLQVLSLFGLYLTYPLTKESIKLRIPIALYFGWTLFLFILHLCYILVSIEWQGFGLSNALWAVIFLTLGTAAAMHLRYHHYDIAFPVVFVWCYLGIAIANGFDELLVTIAALFLIGVMIVGNLYVKKGKK